LLLSAGPHGSQQHLQINLTSKGAQRLKTEQGRLPGAPTERELLGGQPEREKPFAKPPVQSRNSPAILQLLQAFAR